MLRTKAMFNLLLFVSTLAILAGAIWWAIKEEQAA
jgi:hypothetical protein